jgi:hypothetical protein
MRLVRGLTRGRCRAWALLAAQHRRRVDKNYTQPVIPADTAMIRHRFAFVIASAICAIAPTASARKPVQNQPSDPSELVVVHPALNEPVSVVRMAFRAPSDVSPATKGGQRPTGISDVIVEIVNRSARPVSFVRYGLQPPDECPGWSHPLTRYIWYGRTTTPPEEQARAEPPIAPGASREIVIPGYELGSIRSRMQKSRCRLSLKTRLVIENVAFSDGTGW